MLRLCDMFAGGWTREVAELNWLCQTLQSGVASQMTAMSQITDIGFAQPAKAAAARRKDELRELMRRKAALEGVQPRYHAGPRELLSIAQVMHARFVSLEEQEETTLQQGRAAGWLCWRPDETGALRLADGQR